MIKTIKVALATIGLSLFTASALSAQAAEVMLFNETFNSVSTGFSGDDPRRFGIPTIASFNSDENWYGARFLAPDSGDVENDVGVQQFGGSTNLTQTGLVEDNAGLLFQIDASIYIDIVLSFDWRTFSVGSQDRLHVGYFVGDITAGNAGFVNGAIDLRDASQGGTDGNFNWNSGWIELASFSPNGMFSSAQYDLSGAAGQAQVWIGFWLEGDEGDYGKFDNVKVVGQVVPVPAAVWFLGSALLGLLGVRRRNS